MDSLNPIQSVKAVEMTLARMIETQENMYIENTSEDIGFIVYVDDVYENWLTVKIEYNPEYEGVEDITDKVCSYCNFRASLVIHNVDSEYRAEDIKLFQKEINDCMNMKICFCKNNFIYDTHDMCLSCNFKASEEDLECIECPICMEGGPKLSMHLWKCCGASCHKKCRDKMDEKKGCPYCRHVG